MIHGTPFESRRVTVVARGVSLAGDLTRPDASSAIVLFAHGSGSSRFSPRNRLVADALHAAGLGTLLFDLLTSDEEGDRRNVFDIPLLADRLAGATEWIVAELPSEGLRLGYFGASTGAGAALWAAAEPGNPALAVVSRGGRPDLAGPRLGLVRAPTLLIVGGADLDVLALNQTAQAQLRCPNQLAIVPGATHLFEEPGALAHVASLAEAWFSTHLLAAEAGGSR